MERKLLTLLALSAFAVNLSAEANPTNENKTEVIVMDNGVNDAKMIITKDNTTAITVENQDKSLSDSKDLDRGAGLPEAYILEEAGDTIDSIDSEDVKAQREAKAKKEADDKLAAELAEAAKQAEIKRQAAADKLAEEKAELAELADQAQLKELERLAKQIEDERIKEAQTKRGVDGMAKAIELTAQDNQRIELEQDKKMLNNLTDQAVALNSVDSEIKVDEVQRGIDALGEAISLEANKQQDLRNKYQSAVDAATERSFNEIDTRNALSDDEYTRMDEWVENQDKTVGLADEKASYEAARLTSEKEVKELTAISENANTGDISLDHNAAKQAEVQNEQNRLEEVKLNEEAQVIANRQEKEDAKVAAEDALRNELEQSKQELDEATQLVDGSTDQAINQDAFEASLDKTRFGRLKESVSGAASAVGAKVANSYNNTKEYVMDSRPVQAVQINSALLTNGYDSDKTRRENARTVLNNAKQNPKSAAIVAGAGVGAALVTGAAVYGTYKAVTKTAQWLRVKRAKNVIAGIKTVADTKTDSVINAVNFLYNSRFSKDDITNLMTNVTEDRAINKVQRIVEFIPSKRAAKKPVVTLRKRASNVWNATTSAISSFGSKVKGLFKRS